MGPGRERLSDFLRSDRAFPENIFNRLALRLYRHQASKNPVYRRYCESIGNPPVSDWRDIPALPVSAFKYHRVAVFPASRNKRVFQTSGTTRGTLHGKHAFETLGAYDQTVRTLFKKYVLPDLSSSRRIPIVFLVPPASERPESSLSYMGSRVQREFGAARPFYALDEQGVRAEALTRHFIRLARKKKPVLIFTTTFAWADYLDFLECQKIRIRLPKGSRVMETGGYKGRRTAVARPVLVRRTAECLDISGTHVINEYGMTELTSQFYDLSLEMGRPTSVKCIPPWTRVLIVHPATGKPVAQDRRGLIRIIDLANQGSCLAVQTEDEGRLIGGGFEVLGRKKSADLRGCSLSFEELKGLAA